MKGVSHVKGTRGRQDAGSYLEDLGVCPLEHVVVGEDRAARPEEQNIRRDVVHGVVPLTQG